MTVHGWDASDYDRDRGPMDYQAARNDGMLFATHKITEGTGTVHQYAGDSLTRMHNAGIQVIGTYHVVRSGNVAAQLDHYFAELDRQAPGWRSHRNWIHQVDLEKWGYDNVSAGVGLSFVDALRAETDQFVTLYASKGQYGDTLRGCPVPLWNANYGSNPTGWYYHNYPGDDSPRWGAYSGIVPTFLQYGSNNTIGRQGTCDANAFRGTIEQLIALTTKGSEMSIDAHDIICRWSQGFTTTTDGKNTVAPVVWQLRMEEWQKHVNTKLDEGAISAKGLAEAISALQEAVKAIQLGGVDVAALAAALQTALPSSASIADAVATDIASRLES